MSFEHDPSAYMLLILGNQQHLLRSCLTTGDLDGGPQPLKRKALIALHISLLALFATSWFAVCHCFDFRSVHFIVVRGKSHFVPSRAVRAYRRHFGGFFSEHCYEVFG